MNAEQLAPGTIFYFSGYPLTAYRRTRTGCTNLASRHHMRFAGLYADLATAPVVTTPTSFAKIMAATA
jgi:hypothetical protein